jgi:hypothetical protein
VGHSSGQAERSLAIAALSTSPVTYLLWGPSADACGNAPWGWPARFAVDASRGRGRDVRAWLWWPARLVLDGGHRCLDGAGGG